MEIDERLLRLELRADKTEEDINLLRSEIKGERKVIDDLHSKIIDIRDILTEHVIQESRDRVKLFIGISGGLVTGIGVLVLFVLQTLKA